MVLTPQIFGIAPDSICIILAEISSKKYSAENIYIGGYQYRDRFPEAQLGQRKPYVVIILSAIDNLARLFVAIFADLLLFIPIIIFIYISSQIYYLVIICLFVLAFAVSVSVASNISNRELMAANAIYAAVLVMFLDR